MNDSNVQYKKLAEHLSKFVELPNREALYEQMYEAASELFKANKIAIYRYDRKKDKLWCPKYQNLPDTYIQKILKEFRSLPGIKLLESHQTIHIKDTLKYFQDTPMFSFFEKENILSIVFLPMLLSEDSLGSIVLYLDEVNKLSQVEIDIGEALAKVSGAALQKLSLLESSKAALLREKKLNEVYQSLNHSNDLPTILLNVVRLSAELIGADAGLLGVLIDSEMMTFYPYNIPPDIPLRPASRGRGVAWDIVESGHPILTNEYLSLKNAQQKWAKKGISSFIGVPLRTANECFGALTLFNFHPSHSFNDRDLLTVEIIGQQAATIIENLKMIAEANHRANALANALSRQEELDKMKNQFVHTVSHELRSPLGIIFGHAELLELGALGELTDEQLESVQIMGRRVRMLNDLVDDLSALLAAETQEFRRELIDTNLFVTAVSTDHAFKAQELDIRFETSISPNLLWLKGDFTHLQRVFDNLFSNAFKFTPQNGLICLHAFNNNGSVEFELSDTGAGIDPKQLPRIFERFYQVHSAGKPMRSGTGLGLALVKEIVDAHRGSVTVKSTLNEGTTFKISLPGFSPHNSAK
ncbi:MAG: GAF domain-containing sensor histidine kinase [Chloroflexota bacterium]